MKLVLTALVPALFCVATVTYGQMQRIDSLTIAVDNSIGEDRARIFLEMARETLAIDNVLSSNYATQALKLSLESGDTSLIIRSARVKSQVFRRLGQADSALYLLKIALPLSKRHNEVSETNAILNNIGLVYFHIASYDNALKYFFELLNNVEQRHDEFWKGVVFNNIGLVYLELEDYVKAYEYFRLALALKEQIGSDFDRDVTMINMAHCMTALENYSEARLLTDEAYAICGPDCPADRLESIYNNYAVIAFLEHDIERAEEYFNKSYELNQILSNGSLALTNLTYLIKINLARSQYNVAKQYMDEISKLIDNGAPYNAQISQAYLEFIAWFEEAKDIEALSHYQRKYIELRDSIFSQQLTRNLMKIEAEHRERENRAKIDSQNKILALDKKVIRWQRYLNIGIGIVVLLLVAILLLLFKRYKHKQLMNMMLDRQVSQRTRDLELSRDVLYRACGERDQFLLKTSLDLKPHLTTLQGLCLIGARDLDDPKAAEYFSRLESTISAMANIVDHARDTAHAYTNNPEAKIVVEKRS